MKGVFLLTLLGCLASSTARAGDARIDFRRDIEPIFQRSCVSCHGPQKQKYGLRLDHGAAAAKGSNSGPVIVSGKADKSRLMQVISGLDPEVSMPPRELKPLSKAEIALIRAWIDQGAVWPADAKIDVGGAKSRHWAFQPVQRPTPPAVKEKAWVRNPIDGFILARLEKEGSQPSPEADSATLLRRLHLDLIGLPPTPEEVAAFEESAIRNPQSAIEDVVDRLLASPHYAERWARHWLDLARYADSNGYEADRPRAWASTPTASAPAPARCGIWRWREAAATTGPTWSEVPPCARAGQ
jgi:hypothetical protein